MKHTLLVIGMLAAAALPHQSIAQDQDQEEDPRPDRRRWRERFERMVDATPEDRRRMRIDWMVSMMTRTYDLTDEQQQTVRAEIEQMREEHRAELGADAAKVDRVREQMNEFWREYLEKRRNNEIQEGARPWQDPRFQELRKQMRSIREHHPFDWEASIERIEKLLPEDQVATGRERRGEWLERMRERRERRGQDGVSSWRARDGWNNNRGRSRGPEGITVRPGSSESEGRDWEAYTKSIIDKYGFDAAQIMSARSILRELEDERQGVERSQEDIRTEVDRLSDSVEKTQRLKALDEPIEALFEQLKRRLDNLATESQRKAAASSDTAQ